MPYNTRRKSLSLPSLGIHLPNSSRSHRSPSLSKHTASHSIPTSTSTTTPEMNTTTTTTSTTTDFLPPPSKKVKRSHDSASQSSTPSRPSSGKGHPRSNGSRPGSRRGTATYEHTPPPSPPATTETTKIDTEGINDDIVVAVIEQLEKTGNRPHLIKELAAVMTSTNETVANSANPAALLSSRLSLYLKRPWSALSPCPLAKELIPVHPRRVFFYLTTCTHQPLPDNSDDIISPAAQIVTPSVSSASVTQEDEDEEDALARERAQLSPSPEVDLSTPEFEEEEAQIDDDLSGRNGSVQPPTPAGSFSARSSLGPHENSHNTGHYSLSHNHRAISPPLEGDEKEFTQTASSVRERTSSSEDLAVRQFKSPEDGADSSDESTRSGSFANSIDTDNQLQSTDDATHTRNADAGYHDDYLSSNILRAHYEGRGLEATTASALFGTRSPSPVSDSSSLSPLTTATSNAELGSEEFGAGESPAVDVEKVSDILKQTQQKATPLSAINTSSAAMAARSLIASVVGSKRTIDMVETESTASTVESSDSSVEPEGIDTGMPLGMTATFDIDVGSCGNVMGNGVTDVDKTVVIRTDSEMDLSMESWSDLRSPETVEVGELDEFFADI